MAAVIHVNTIQNIEIAAALAFILDIDQRKRRPTTHSRTSSRDERMNIRYILNCLKSDASTNQLLMSSAVMIARAAAAEHGAA